MEKRPKFQIFDGDEKQYSLVVASNANIHDILEVICFTAGKPKEERQYYALHGELDPHRYEKDEETGEEVGYYRFHDRYTRANMFDALAEKLFYGIEPLGEIKETDNDQHPDEYVVTDKDRHANLIRSEVRSAFDSYLGEFGITPYEVGSLLDMLNRNPNFQNPMSLGMENLMEKATQNTKQPKPTIKND